MADKVKIKLQAIELFNQINDNVYVKRISHGMDLLAHTKSCHYLFYEITLSKDNFSICDVFDHTCMSISHQTVLTILQTGQFKHWEKQTITKRITKAEMQIEKLNHQMRKHLVN